MDDGHIDPYSLTHWEPCVTMGTVCTVQRSIQIAIGQLHCYAEKTFSEAGTFFWLPDCINQLLGESVNDFTSKNERINTGRSIDSTCFKCSRVLGNEAWYNPRLIEPHRPYSLTQALAAGARNMYGAEISLPDTLPVMLSPRKGAIFLSWDVIFHLEGTIKFFSKQTPSQCRSVNFQYCTFLFQLQMNNWRKPWSGLWQMGSQYSTKMGGHPDLRRASLSTWSRLHYRRWRNWSGSWWWCGTWTGRTTADRSAQGCWSDPTRQRTAWRSWKIGTIMDHRKVSPWTGKKFIRVFRDRLSRKFRQFVGLFRWDQQFLQLL